VSSANGQAWQHRARCRNIGIDLFFPESTDVDTITKSLGYCNACPVKVECLQWALEEGVAHGIWGGIRLDDLKAGRRKEMRDHLRRRSA
jgi:WhiB family transcriptional regulator, redox-sensing transcriptional regulator